MTSDQLRDYKHYKRLPDDETYDAVRLTQVERWKESELSGDEWRFSWTIELLRKGKVIARCGAHTLEQATARLGWFIHVAGESEDFDRAQFDRETVHQTCMQPGCVEVATVVYRLKAEYSRVGEGPLPESSLPMPLRRFCDRHAHRGDCGLEDADCNYISMPALKPKDQPDA